MPVGHSWNLSEWMRALGIRRKEQPDVVHVVQPVEIVGDHSAFSAQLVPATAWMGGYKPAVALERSVIQLVSAAPGGSYLRALAISGNQNWYWTVRATASTVNNQLAPYVNEMGNTPTLSRVLLGSIAAIPAGENCRFTGTGAGQILTDLAYVPPGWAFEWWDGSINGPMNASILFEDCEAQRGAR